jgi:hypothetical protein
MPISVICQHCQSKFRASDTAAGRTTKCPKCAQPMQIVAATTKVIANSPPVQRPAKKPAFNITPQITPATANTNELDFEPDMSFMQEALAESAAEKKAAQANAQAAKAQRSVLTTTAPSQYSSPSAAASDGGFFEDGGTPLLAKMIMAAVAAPGICIALIAKKGSKDLEKLINTPTQLFIMIASLSVAGAIAAGILGCRDVVQQRLARGKYVPLLFRIMFMNFLFTMITWIVMLIGLTIVGFIIYLYFLTKR